MMYDPISMANWSNARDKIMITTYCSLPKKVDKQIMYLCFDLADYAKATAVMEECIADTRA